MSKLLNNKNGEKIIRLIADSVPDNEAILLTQKLNEKNCGFYDVDVCCKKNKKWKTKKLWSTVF